nr:Flp family type IVb pilin [Sphingomonas quercus]
MLRKGLDALARDSRGASAIEYGLIVALIALAIVGGLSAVGGNVLGFWQRVDQEVRISG